MFLNSKNAENFGETYFTLCQKKKTTKKEFSVNLLISYKTQT